MVPLASEEMCKTNKYITSLSPKQIDRNSTASYKHWVRDIWYLRTNLFLKHFKKWRQHEMKEHYGRVASKSEAWCNPLLSFNGLARHKNFWVCFLFCKKEGSQSLETSPFQVLPSALPHLTIWIFLATMRQISSLSTQDSSLQSYVNSLNSKLHLLWLAFSTPTFHSILSPLCPSKDSKSLTFKLFSMCSLRLLFLGPTEPQLSPVTLLTQ